MPRSMHFAAALLSLTLTACGVLQPARMVQPSLPASTQLLPIEGLGGGTRGELRVADNGGEFRRGATRLEIFEAVSFDRGGSSFRLAGSDFAQEVSARCTMRQTSVGWKILEANAKKLSYECDIDGLPARFALRAAAPTSLAVSAPREGEVQLNGVVLRLRSVHRVEGSPLELPTPIGFVFEAGGQPVASLELNGTVPQLRLPADRGDLRRAVLVAAVAVSLLWDPAAR